MSIRVLKPGPLSSVQDLGRYGYQRFGVIVSGVMDEWSHRVANLLVGNPQTEASLEITLLGPSLVFEHHTLIAISGADLSPRIGDQAVPMNCPILVRSGSQLDFGRRVSGCRAYLAVHGGFDVPAVMHSKSTYLRAGFGGFEGRAIKKGDQLKIGTPNPAVLDVPGNNQEVTQPRALGVQLNGEQAFAAIDTHGLAPPLRPSSQTGVIRLIPGQQWAAFTAQAHERLVCDEFRVNSNSDRMGYRLEGSKLELREPLEMISEGVAFGSMQVPPDGNPIVLMADRQTAGGYPKIASVASVDLPLLAQAIPQHALRFEMIDLESAQTLYLQREAWFERLHKQIETLKGLM